MATPYQNHSPVALITGGARRIGAVIATTLHAAGFRVIIHYRHSESEAIALKNTLNQQREYSAEIIQADLDDQTVYHRMINDSEKIYGRLDLLVNNASTFTPSSIGAVDLSHWNQLMNSNLKAPFFISQAAIPLLKKYNGNIINITDIHAKKPMKNYAVYSIAKAGLRMMTQALALECAPVRVNAVAPGSVLWPEHENTLSETEKNSILSRTILHTQVNSVDIAHAVLFLATQPTITAQTIAVDGGRL